MVKYNKTFVKKKTKNEHYCQQDKRLLSEYILGGEKPASKVESLGRLQGAWKFEKRAKLGIIHLGERTRFVKHRGTVYIAGEDTPFQLRRYSSALKSEFHDNGKPICPRWNCRLLTIKRARRQADRGQPPLFFSIDAACEPPGFRRRQMSWSFWIFDFSSTYSVIEFGSM